MKQKTEKHIMEVQGVKKNAVSKRSIKLINSQAD